MISFDQVTAVIPTRGDVSLGPVLDSLPFDDVIVWDNSERPRDLKVYGRYEAIKEARNKIIYTQDDDCILGEEALLRLLMAYQPDVLVSNMPRMFRRRRFYRDHCLLGFGSVFDSHLPAEAFHRYSDGWLPGDNNVFLRQCDMIFSGLTPHTRVDVPYQDRPFWNAPERMWKQDGHQRERNQVLKRIKRVR